MEHRNGEDINIHDSSTVFHGSVELANVYRCCKIERDWLDDNQTPSSQYIAELHSTLFYGVEEYQRKGLIRSEPGVYRNTDLKTVPDNLYVRGLDVRPLMSGYCQKLDEMIGTLSPNPLINNGELIHDAAWFYYVYGKIHPFYDGNGRIGRMVMRRILRGGGYKDIVFAHLNNSINKRFINDRNKHIDALRQVDKTGNLAVLERYICELLISIYGNSGSERNIRLALERVSRIKSEEIASQPRVQDIANIWDRFGDIDIYLGDNATNNGM